MWDKLKGLVGAAAPLLGTALGGSAGGAVASMIASALGVEDRPEAIEAAIAADPEALIKLKAIEREHERELRRMVLEAETARLSEVNQSIRAEAASGDAYVRRWRPTFGYCACATWVLQGVLVFGVTVYVALKEPGRLAEVINAMTALMRAAAEHWMYALAVLGIAVWKRSEDKKVAAGRTPAGVVGALVGALGKGK